MTFERTYIISLPHRRERTAALQARFPRAVVVNAFHGRDLAAPKWFRAGFGAWGCYMSHLHVLMSAVHDKLDSYMVLEDDAILIPEFEDKLALFCTHLPTNWGQAYLGGAHQSAPEMLNEFVYACHSVDRTHAFAVSARAFRPMLSHLLETERFFIDERPRHVDQVLQQAHEKCLWPVYAPTWWFAGQAGGLSTISLERLPDRWWHCPAYSRALPFVLCPEQPTETMLQHVFFGNKANEQGDDWRLLDAIGDRSKLAPFLSKLAVEALVFGKLPGLKTTKLTVDDVHQLGFAAYPSTDDIAEIARYPYNNLINNGYYPKRTARP
jgi:hypothetical protein